MSDLLHIDEVFLFVADNPGVGEGIVGHTRYLHETGETFIPFVAADRARYESLIPMAERIATLMGEPIRVIRFTTRTEVQTILPKA